MDHQRRHIDLFQQLAHIEAIDCGACGDNLPERVRLPSARKTKTGASKRSGGGND
jgi:hypothetical protein